MNKIVNYYKILEVREDASSEVIEKAYKALCVKYHPDKHPPDKRTWAMKKMQELNEAYSVLSDPVQRRSYGEQKKQQLLQIFWEDGLIGLVKVWLNK
jgi:DnaJ-class molecular chaperone